MKVGDRSNVHVEVGVRDFVRERPAVSMGVFAAQAWIFTLTVEDSRADCLKQCISRVTSD